MNQQRLLKVILAPQVSEKSTMLAETRGQVVFKVAKDATKLEIRKAVESLFDVKVASVSTLIVKGKKKRFGKLDGKRSDWKKAYISLQEGSNIDFTGAEQ